MKTSAVTPYLEEVMQLVADFLVKIDQKPIAKQLKQSFNLPVEIATNNPLLEMGLSKIIKKFTKIYPKVNQYYLQRADLSSSDNTPVYQSQKQNHLTQTHQAIPSHNANKRSQGFFSKFDAPKRLETIDSDQPISKKSSKDKVMKEFTQQQVSSDFLAEQEDTFQLEKGSKRIKKQSQLSKKHKKMQIQSEQDQIPSKPQVKNIHKKQTEIENHNPKALKKNSQSNLNQIKVEQQVQYRNNNSSKNGHSLNGTKKHFSRVDFDDDGTLQKTLERNRFVAIHKFGEGGEDYGELGWEKLKDTRGDSFKKTKAKLKNKSFQGQMINAHAINSIMIE